MPTHKNTRFFVKRARWLPNWDDNLIRMPGSAPVASFATFDEAEADRERREQEVRAAVSPFLAGPLVQYWSHLDEPRLRDWLMDHGIDPPEQKKGQRTAWGAWWKKNQKKLGGDKRAAVWEALDKVRFYSVEEDGVRPTAYAVVGVHWEWNGDYFVSNFEGGDLQSMFWTRAKAEAECKRLTASERPRLREQTERCLGDYPGEDVDSSACFSLFARIRTRNGLFAPDTLAQEDGEATVQDVPLYEVVEVELDGIEPPTSSRQAKTKTKTKAAKRPSGTTIYVVQQQTVLTREVPPDTRLLSGLPERAFATEKAAAKFAAERTRQCRGIMNPFAHHSDWNSVWHSADGKKRLLGLVAALRISPPGKPDKVRNEIWSSPRIVDSGNVV